MYLHYGSYTKQWSHNFCGALCGYKWDEWFDGEFRVTTHTNHINSGWSLLWIHVFVSLRHHKVVDLCFWWCSLWQWTGYVIWCQFGVAQHKKQWGPVLWNDIFAWWQSHKLMDLWFNSVIPGHEQDVGSDVSFQIQIQRILSIFALV